MKKLVRIDQASPITLIVACFFIKKLKNQLGAVISATIRTICAFPKNCHFHHFPTELKIKHLSEANLSIPEQLLTLFEHILSN